MTVTSPAQLRLVASATNALDGRSDDELVLLVAARSREAFAALVRRHQARVIAFCARATGSSDLGRDVAQDVFLELWRSAASYRPEGKFPSWLFRLARNRVISLARRPVEHPTAPVTLDAKATEAAQLDDMLARERERLLREALSELGEHERTTLLLHYQEGLSYETIASMVGSPAGTVRSWAFQSLRRLRRLMAPDGGRQ